MKKLFIIVNEDRFFLSHRKEIGLEAKKQGFDVTVVAKDLGNHKTIRAMGLNTIDLPINPSGFNLREELKTFRFLVKLYRDEKPTIVHHVGLKNILWGGLAAKLSNVPGVVNAVSGLGALFNEDRLTMIHRSILSVIRFSNARKGVKVIFQNNEDKAVFINNKVSTEDQTEFTKGAGIDLNDFVYTPEPADGKIKIIFTARMVKEKGVLDLIEAAKILEPEYKDKVQFLLCGRTTANRNAISAEYLAANCDGEYIAYLGERNDVKELLCGSHIMAFPSYYREGLPKSLIEACAIGRPIITCDSTGCRDVVTDGENGLLVEPKNPSLLAETLCKLIEDPALRLRMGKNSRKKAEQDFSVKEVVDTHMKIYRILAGS